MATIKDMVIEVEGSYGVLKIDPNGRVISVSYYDQQEAAYEDIWWFDMQEVRSTYGRIADYYDILDLGYWTNKGEYVGPDDGFREQVKREAEEVG